MLGQCDCGELHVRAEDVSSVASIATSNITIPFLMVQNSAILVTIWSEKRTLRNLQIYRYIAEVAKSGSVRKAAEKLAITPSSLNRRIQSFEYEIGGQILREMPAVCV